MTKRLLIMGGGRDPNVQWIEEAARAVGVEYDAIYINPNPEPCIAWDLSSNTLMLNDAPMSHTAAFMRYDVFSGLYTNSEFAHENAANWYSVFSSWCQINNVRTFNQHLDGLSGSKISMLALAKKHGFEIPVSCITNSKNTLERLGDPTGYIAKPVSGGTYCIDLPDAIDDAEWTNEVAASPAIIQTKLIYPEFRVYRIGQQFFAFNIDSETLDSRLDKSSKIVPIKIDTFPQSIIDCLTSLTDEIKCDFCAIDLKTDPETEALVFLELNNGPMFAGYDKTMNGAMGRAMVKFLMNDGG